MQNHQDRVRAQQQLDLQYHGNSALPVAGVNPPAPAPGPGALARAKSNPQQVAAPSGNRLSDRGRGGAGGGAGSHNHYQAYSDGEADYYGEDDDEAGQEEEDGDEPIDELELALQQCTRRIEHLRQSAFVPQAQGVGRGGGGNGCAFRFFSFFFFFFLFFSHPVSQPFFACCMPDFRRTSKTKSG